MNRYLHYIGVPATVFSIFMALNWMSIDIAHQYKIPFTWILLFSVLGYYFALNMRLAALCTVVFSAVAIIATDVAKPSPTNVSATLFFILFFSGLTLQFVGHYFEKQKPAFLLGFMQLFIGPLFLIVELLKKLNVEQYFLSE